MQLKDFLQQRQQPLMAYLELTHRCSFLCVHCYIPEAQRRHGEAAQSQLRTEEIKKLLEELKAEQTLFLVLTGGEIFLRPDLLEITQHAVSLGLAVKYYTNGFHITPAWGERLKSLGIYAVDVSIYGANEQTYYQITKVRGSYERVMQGLRRLQASGVRLNFKTPVMQQNYRDIPAIQQMAKDFGATYRYDLVLIPRFDGDLAPTQYSLSDEELHIFLQSMHAAYDAKALKPFEVHACSVGKWSVVISPTGEVYPCIELRDSLGNIRQQSFASIWHGNPKMRQIRDTMATMQADPAIFGDGLCTHCPAHSLHATGDMTKPSDEYMRIAKVKRRFLQAG